MDGKAHLLMYIFSMVVGLLIVTLLRVKVKKNKLHVTLIVGSQSNVKDYCFEKKNQVRKQHY